MLKSIANFVVLVLGIVLLAWVAESFPEELGWLKEWAPWLLGAGFVVVSLVSSFRRAAEANRGVALSQQGRSLEALQIFERLDERWPRVVVARGNRGLMLYALWRIEEAREVLSKVVRRPRLGERPYLFLFRPATAVVYALTGDVAAARELVALQPDAPYAHLASAVIAAREGRFEEVREAAGRREVQQIGGNATAFSAALQGWADLELEGATHRTVDQSLLWGEGSPDSLRRLWPEFVDAVERLSVEPVSKPLMKLEAPGLA